MRNERFMARITRAKIGLAGWLALPALLALPVAVQAQITYTTNGGALTLSTYAGTSASVNLPSQTYGLPVVSIGASAFAQTLSLTNVTIPATITNLGSQAFAGCANLAGVYFQGNAPTLSDSSVFHADNSATVYYQSAATGWGSSFDGLPTVLLNPQCLRVTITPAAAITAGARWAVDGGAWQDSDATVTNLAVGNHALSFNTLSGWMTPVNQAVSIAADVGTAASGAYTFIGNYGLVVNGGFETRDFSGWTFVGSPNDAFVDDGTGAGAIAPQSGTYDAALGQVGSLGSLSQTLATTSGGNYLLSFWVNSPDGRTPNEFLVSWNGQTLLDQKNMPAIGWTNVQLVVSATGASTVLQFGFQDDNSYLGLDDISVVEAPANAGSLQVTIAPSGAMVSGAGWQVDGGLVQPSGANVLGLAAGNHTVSFTPVSGWTTPANQVVAIKSGQTTGANGVYTFLASFGLVTNGGFQSGDYSGWGITGTAFVDDGSQTGINPQSGRYEAALGQIGSLGYLTQTIATTPGLHYLLSFWVNCDGFTPNQFLASWNGKTLVNDVNLPAIGWTNMQFLVTAKGSASALQFGFRDDNSYLELGDISLAAVSVTGANVQTNQFGFAVSGLKGSVVIVEAKDNLASPAWYPIQTNILSNGTAYFTDPQSTQYPARFFRVRFQ